MDVKCEEELSEDAAICAKLKQFSEAAFKVQDMVELVTGDRSLFDKLSNGDKIKYNLLLSYSLNSLFWMYLRTEGIDPSNHRIRSENERLKRAMVRAKQINDKNTLMPRVNKDVAKRFVRSSLWKLKQKKLKSLEKNIDKSESPPVNSTT